MPTNQKLTEIECGRGVLNSHSKIMRKKCLITVLTTWFTENEDFVLVYSEAPLKPSSNSLSILDYVYPILQAECLGMKFHFAQYIYSTAISTAFAFDIYYG